MIKLEVNRGSVGLTVKGSGMDALTELVISALVMLKKLSMDEDMYIELRNTFIQTIESVTYDEIEEGLRV